MLLPPRNFLSQTQRLLQSVMQALLPDGNLLAKRGRLEFPAEVEEEEEEGGPWARASEQHGAIRDRYAQRLAAAPAQTLAIVT